MAETTTISNTKIDKTEIPITIIVSPNGTQYKITVDDNGAINTEELP